MQEKIKVGITHGDTNGIGYELILKTFAQPEILELFTPIVYGSEHVAHMHRETLKLDTTWHRITTWEEAQEGKLNLIDLTPNETPQVTLGEATPEAGRLARLALDAAVADAQKGNLQVLVTCPINKASVQGEDFHFPGHTEYLAEKLGGQPLMLLMNELMRVALVTTHIPLCEVAQHITTEALARRLHQLLISLKSDFLLSTPRIAMLSLNPHCGDEGLIGKEEREVIYPLIEQLSPAGVPCFGPYSADGFFGSGQFRHFDAILAMYHDQGLAPFKSLAMETGVNFTAGLPIVRTSPDHGVAYDIAGRGLASETSFRTAIFTAIDIYRNRLRHEEATAAPLPFSSKERRHNSRS